MSHRHDDAEPVEHDPTGMRALLGSLPDPGPMPDHLVARIAAALEEESRRSAATAPDAGATWAPPQAPGHLAAAAPASSGGEGQVLPMRRRRGWLLGAAAAAVVALGVGGVVVDRLAPDGLQASLGIARGGDDAGAAESAAGSAADAASGPAVVAADGALGVLVVGSGTDYGPDSLAALARDLPRGPAGAGSAVGGGDLAGESLGHPAAARSCAAGLGVDPDEAVTVDLASFAGREAAVVVAAAADGVASVWVVGRDCTATSPGIVEGPLALQ